MFGAGWTEMLIIGIVALVVIGPKDLPIVMRKLGRIIATVRRMGTEFQREVAKTTGFEEIADLRRSITEPLRQTSEEIAKEFNKITTTGVEPSGVMKPGESGTVYEQIAATSGVTADAKAAPPPVMKPLAVAEPSPAPAEASAPWMPTAPTPEPAAAPAKPKTPRKRATAVPATTETAVAVAPSPAPRKPRARAVAKTVAAAAPVETVAVKPSRARAKKA